MVKRLLRGRSLVLFPLLGLGTSLSLYYGYFSGPGEVGEIFNGKLDGPAMVIAPHNDDEVLGVGGVLQRHLRQGDRVTVVLLTNGDGQYHGPFRNPAQVIQFGYQRQEESLRALAKLGIPEQDIIFLGYPDRGLAILWNHYWSCERLYTSPQTRKNHSPYKNSFTPKAPYCGLSLVQDLEALLRRERPKTIYLPHPNDRHPDHWSAYAFTLYALELLKLAYPEEDSFRDVRLLTYLVHYGRWPMPRGKFLNATLKFPRPLQHTDTRWLSIPLTWQEVISKYQAIREYKSQVQFMPLYLISFARRNELLGEIPTLQLGNGGSLDGYPAISYPDPKQSGLLSRLNGHNDIKAVKLALTAEGLLNIEVETFSLLRPTDEVLIHLKTFSLDGSLPTMWRFLQAGRRLYLNGEPLRDLKVTHEARQNTFRLSLPLERLGSPQAFVIGAELMHKGVTFSKAAYRLVEITPSPSPSTSATLSLKLDARPTPDGIH